MVLTIPDIAALQNLKSFASLQHILNQDWNLNASLFDRSLTNTMDHRWTDDGSFDAIFFGRRDDGLFDITMNVRGIEIEDLGNVLRRHIVVDLGRFISSSGGNISHDPCAGDVDEFGVFVALSDALDDGYGASDVVCGSEVFSWMSDIEQRW